ncbi:hypothetical protein N0V95_009249 [Ascochyta clinopodiicola]|nr:hypothetical protein N0V95_009249 [Ascochyta clinopodiicola]
MALGFEPLSEPEKKLINIGLAFQYDDPNATDGLQKAIQWLTAAIDRTASNERVADKHIYMNYAGGWQDVLTGYGNQSLMRLRSVADRYDVRGMFQKQVKGGFKLGIHGD